MKTSLATATILFNLQVNASGNGAMYIFPRLACGNGTTVATSFCTKLFADTFDPATGGEPGETAVFAPGPLYSSSSAME